MLSQDLLGKIQSGEIDSRRKLYLITGRSRKLLKWLDGQNILVPTLWTKDLVKTRLKDAFELSGRIPLSKDDSGLTRAAQNHYGGWNQALFEVFGSWNQARYTNHSNEELLNLIVNYVKENGALPPREVFDGKAYPYFEAYFTRFSKTNWSQILGLLDLSGIEFDAGKHGWGQRYVVDGVIYLSYQEMIIGKYLNDRGIEFQKEVPYGNSQHIFDFYLPKYDVYIEYYGISTDEYNDRVETKRALYDNRRVVEIFKSEGTLERLEYEISNQLRREIAFHDVEVYCSFANSDSTRDRRLQRLFLDGTLIATIPKKEG